MPNTKSAIKQNRQNKTRNRRNRMVRSAYRTALKKFTHLLENGNIADAEKELSVIHHEIDTAAKKGIIKKETASRKKSRVTLALNKLKVAQKG